MYVFSIKSLIYKNVGLLYIPDIASWDKTWWYSSSAEPQPNLGRAVGEKTVGRRSVRWLPWRTERGFWYCFPQNRRSDSHSRRTRSWSHTLAVECSEGSCALYRRWSSTPPSHSTAPSTTASPEPGPARTAPAPDPPSSSTTPSSASCSSSCWSRISSPVIVCL